jgi:hypothetical protein
MTSIPGALSASGELWHSQEILQVAGWAFTR